MTWPDGWGEWVPGIWGRGAWHVWTGDRGGDFRKLPSGKRLIWHDMVTSSPLPAVVNALFKSKSKSKSNANNKRSVQFVCRLLSLYFFFSHFAPFCFDLDYFKCFLLFFCFASADKETETIKNKLKFSSKTSDYNSTGSEIGVGHLCGWERDVISL